MSPFPFFGFPFSGLPLEGFLGFGLLGRFDGHLLGVSGHSVGSDVTTGLVLTGIFVGFKVGKLRIGFVLTGNSVGISVFVGLHSFGFSAGNSC